MAEIRGAIVESAGTVGLLRVDTIGSLITTALYTSLNIHRILISPCFRYRLPAKIGDHVSVSPHMIIPMKKLSSAAQNEPLYWMPYKHKLDVGEPASPTSLAFRRIRTRASAFSPPIFRRPR